MGEDKDQETAEQPINVYSQASEEGPGRVYIALTTTGWERSRLPSGDKSCSTRCAAAFIEQVQGR